MPNTEKSCGAVVYTIQNKEIHYLLIKSNDNVISFPKGHMELNESEKETALREIFEETSLRVNIVDTFKEIIHYTLPNGNTKEVTYFLAEYKNQVPIHNEGFEQNKYFVLKYTDAANLLTYDNTKAILKKANKYIESKNKVQQLTLKSLKKRLTIT